MKSRDRQRSPLASLFNTNPHASNPKLPMPFWSRRNLHQDGVHVWVRTFSTVREEGFLPQRPSILTLPTGVAPVRVYLEDQLILEGTSHDADFVCCFMFFFPQADFLVNQLLLRETEKRRLDTAPGFEETPNVNHAC